ncbi:diguanylate cyclase [Vibrio sp. PP-XX7]
MNLHYGIPAGDLLLQQLSVTLSQLIPRPNTISRWDGNEFIVLLHHAEQQDAVATAEKIQAMVQQQTFNVSGSILLCA